MSTVNKCLNFLYFLQFLLDIRGDNVDLSVINPRREKSGTYKVIFRNAQGQDERDIHVNIMGEQNQYFLMKCYVDSQSISHLILFGIDQNYNFVDKPTPPMSCKVTDVFHDNVIVNWTPPADDGGTDITR